MKQFIEILLVLALFLVFYTYVGYGIVAWVLVKIRTSLGKTFKAEFDPEYLPEVTLVVPAYNEMSCIESKLFNSLDLDSDGDGCSDAIEGGSSSTATSTTAYPSGTDTNTNGCF